MGAVWVVPVIVGILILGTLGMPNAFADSCPDPNNPACPSIIIPPIPQNTLVSWNVTNFGTDTFPAFYKVAVYDLAIPLLQLESIPCGQEMTAQFTQSWGTTDEKRTDIKNSISSSVTASVSAELQEKIGIGYFGLTADEKASLSTTTSSNVEQAYSQTSISQTTSTKDFDYPVDNKKSKWNLAYSVYAVNQTIQYTSIPYVSLDMLKYLDTSLADDIEGLKVSIQEDQDDIIYCKSHPNAPWCQGEDTEGDALPFDKEDLAKYEEHQKNVLSDITNFNSVPPSQANQIHPPKYFEPNPSATEVTVGGSTQIILDKYAKKMCDNPNINPPSIGMTQTEEFVDDGNDTRQRVEVTLRFLNTESKEGKTIEIPRTVLVITDAIVNENGNIQPIGWPSEFSNYGDKITPKDLPQHVSGLLGTGIKIIEDENSWKLMKSLTKDFKPPNKQRAEGVSNDEVSCNEGMVKMKRVINELPICVTPSTAQKLYEREYAVYYK